MKTSTIEKGNPFYPVSAFRNKLFLYIITVFITVTGSIIIFGGLIFFLVGLDNDPSDDGLFKFLQTESSSLIMWYFIISFSLMLIITILTIYYVRNIEYLIEETEVIVKKGIINKTVKHVPFRTITNVSSRYGIFDRLFGIGTCEIETAGKSGQQTGPEEKIEGIRNFRVVRDIILNELRTLRGQYATTTELAQPIQAEDVLGDVGYQKEILDELQEIKKVLLEK